MPMELVIRFDYGSIVPWVRHVEGGIRATAGPDTVYCRASVPLRGENMHTVAEFAVRSGERATFEFTYVQTNNAEPPPAHAEESLRATEAFWTDWASHCKYEGRWRDAVLR